MKKQCDCGEPSIRKDGACRRCAQMECVHTNRTPAAKNSRPIPTGSISYRQWAEREAKRHEISIETFYNDSYAGRISLPERDIQRGPNGRAVSVTESAQSVDLVRRKGEIRLRDWYAQEAAKRNISHHALEMQVYRGRISLPGELRRGPTGRVIAVVI